MKHEHIITAYYKGTVDQTLYRWKIECGIYISLPTVNIFMDVSHSNNAKTETALVTVQHMEDFRRRG